MMDRWLDLFSDEGMGGKQAGANRKEESRAIRHRNAFPLFARGVKINRERT